MKMVIETSRPIARVAKELGINEGTLGNWVNAYRREHARLGPPLEPVRRAGLARRPNAVRSASRCGPGRDSAQSSIGAHS